MKKKLLLFIMLTLIGMLRVSADDVYVGNALPTENTDYFLYNVGTGQFLGCCNSANYGCQVDIDDIGLLLTLQKKSDGVYSLSTSKSVYSGAYIGIDPGKSPLFTNKTSLNFTFTTVDGLTNTFTISAPVSSIANYYLALSSGAYLTASTTAPTNNSGYWKLVSVSDRNAYIQSKASQTNGLDGTFNMSDYDFNGSMTHSQFWKGVSSSMFAGVGKSSNYNYVAYINGNSSAYNIYQTLTVPNGYYKVSCQGFYRNGTIATAMSNKENGKESIRTYLYALDNGDPLTETKTPLMSIFEGSSPKILWYSLAEDNTDFGYVPSLGDANKLESSAYYLLKGLYTDNEVFTKVTNGSLTIGVKGDALTGATDLTVFDKMRLTYYGSDTSVDTTSIHYTDLQNSYNTEKTLSFTSNASGTVTVYANVPSTLTNNLNTAVATTYSTANYTTLQKLLKAFHLSVSSSLIYLTDAATYIPAATPSAVKVFLDRKITAGQWNTICLPFSMTYDQIAAAFGTGTKVAAFASGSSNGDLTFSTLASSESTIASTPYLINPANTQSAYFINGVMFTADAAATVSPVTNYNFIGNYNNTTIASGKYFLNGGNFYISQGSSTITPFHAWFDLPAITTSQAKLSLIIDGETTSIDNIDNDSISVSTNVYNLNGQMIHRSSIVNNLTKGLYIINGKKLVIK